MNKIIPTAFVTVSVLILILFILNSKSYLKVEIPHSQGAIVYIMYTEKCMRCGFDKAESEYSIASNQGNSYCPQCNSSVEFELVDGVKKIITKQIAYKGGIEND